jgi:hypothetical protein
MGRDSRTETFARVGRSYPRIVLDPAPQPAPALSRLGGRYAVTLGVLAFLGALGLLGWLLAR